MNSINLDPYIFFRGKTKEAMEFYQSVFGGELKMQTYGEVPGMEVPAGAKPEYIMHADLSGGLVEFMASDSTRLEDFGESFISLSISGTDKAKLEDVFNKLSEGGKVTSPLKKEFWGDTFGGLTDKFGVDWMFNIGEPSDQSKQNN